MRRRRTALGLATLAGLAGLTLSTAQPALAAPNAEPSSTYLVQLDPSVTDPAAVAEQEANRVGGTVRGVYRYAFKGFSIDAPKSKMSGMRTGGKIRTIEPDHEVHAFAQTVPTGLKRMFADQNPNLKINGQSDYKADVDVAVVDTGVDFDHPDLNVAGRTDCSSGSCRDNSGDDGNGHGTHVAGTIGAKDNGEGVVGIAPDARIWAVQVLNAQGSGSLTGVVAGIDWVAKHADTVEVMNMSLGCENCQNQSMDQAITNAVNKGVAVVVAAGNSKKDSKTFSPANHPDVLTVSALADYDGEPGGKAAATCRQDVGKDDDLASYSNFGTVVEVDAPGTCILSTWMNGGYNTISGTSMASPHAAGAAALLAVGDHKPKNAADVKKIYGTLAQTGNSNWNDVSGDGAKEPLLDLHDASKFPAVPLDPTKPVAKLAGSCSATSLACTFDGSGSTDDKQVTGYAWDFGDGSTGTEAKPAHTYAKAGSYQVTLKVTDGDGNSASASQTFAVGQPPEQPVAASFTASCFGPACEFDGSASTGAASYSWDFGDGSSGTGATATHSYPAATANYTVTLTAKSAGGKTATASKSVSCFDFGGIALCLTE